MEDFENGVRRIRNLGTVMSYLILIGLYEYYQNNEGDTRKKFCDLDFYGDSPEDAMMEYCRYHGITIEDYLTDY